MRQGHWIEENRRDGWLRANATGPDSQRWITRDCDMVTSDGKLFASRESGRQGNICPRMDAPCPQPSAVPCASPAPTPTPGGSPTPAPSGAPPINPVTGNYPVPPAGVCPPWFAGARARVGIAVLGQRACSSKPDCYITNLNLTEKSIPPFCEHSCFDEDGSYAVGNCRRECELWGPCQARPFVQNLSAPDFLGAFIAHPDWDNQWGDCDKRTSGECNPAVQDCRLNHICHDQAISRGGVTRMMACPPGVAPGGSGCSESSYRTPQGASAREVAGGAGAAGTGLAGAVWWFLRRRKKRQVKA